MMSPTLLHLPHLPIFQTRAPPHIIGHLYPSPAKLPTNLISPCSSSNHCMLTHVLAHKEHNMRQMHQLLKLTFAKLDDKSKHATEAECHTVECLVCTCATVDACTQANAGAATAHSKLALYKLQLEQAQHEIFCAQEMLDGLETCCHDAEEHATHAHSMAHKLQEEQVIKATQEEGKEQGWHEGLCQGMLLGCQEAENQFRGGSCEENDPHS
jgi:hypothetical protein